MHIRSLRETAHRLCIALLCVILGIGQAMACSMLLCGAGGGGSVATKFLLANTGSVLLINTGVKFLIQ